MSDALATGEAMEAVLQAAGDREIALVVLRGWTITPHGVGKRLSRWRVHDEVGNAIPCTNGMTRARAAQYALWVMEKMR